MTASIMALAFSSVSASSRTGSESKRRVAPARTCNSTDRRGRPRKQGAEGEGWRGGRWGRGEGVEKQERRREGFNIRKGEGRRCNIRRGKRIG